MVLVPVGLIAGCGPGHYLGPQPIQPPVSREAFHLFAEFVEVETLTPELRWEEFPPHESSQSDPAVKRDRLGPIGYELRIWRTTNGYSGELVYARDELPQARHRVEVARSPSARYLWSVRARFTADGKHHVSQWAISGPAMRTYVVPNPMCFRFATPAGAR